jgi:3' terminal RNA ribose 2'-O-methyltransferase Hen1
MLLSISTTHKPATDLGYLLHKHPSRSQSFDLAFGRAHVFYTEATDDRCSASLLLDIDPVGLVRNRRGPAGEGGALEQYVNDRPYVASSFLSVAISRIFGQALGGRSKEREELAQTAIPLQAKIAVLPCRGGEQLLRRLFEPLGYSISLQNHTLDEKFSEWGESKYFTVTIEAVCRLSEMLSHIYVLVPVLDDDKHYWVGDDEVEKLLRHGDQWLSSHPERELIVSRYLKYQKRLARAALARLIEEDQTDPDEAETERDREEEKVEAPIGLNEQRMRAVVESLKEIGAKRVIDLGCGEGRLLKRLMEEKSFEEITGVDVSHRALSIADERLKLHRLPERQKDRVKLIHGSLTYRDKRLSGYDAATVIEVIEHLDIPRLAAFERVLFEFARPQYVILTTPNAEYNAKFERLPAGQLRHRDHRFEWTREEFQAWANRVAEAFGYRVRFLAIGPEDEQLGPPTQMAVFEIVER